MTIIGNRNLDFFVGAVITVYDPVADTESQLYLSNRSYLTRIDDTIDPNRQFIGLLSQAYEINISWFKGNKIGGRSERSFGALKAIKADGAHSLSYLFDDGGLKVQGRTVTY